LLFGVCRRRRFPSPRARRLSPNACLPILNPPVPLALSARASGTSPPHHTTFSPYPLRVAGGCINKTLAVVRILPGSVSFSFLAAVCRRVAPRLIILFVQH
jgi:hypothetical protein